MLHLHPHTMTPTLKHGHELQQKDKPKKQHQISDSPPCRIAPTIFIFPHPHSMARERGHLTRKCLAGSGGRVRPKSALRGSYRHPGAVLCQAAMRLFRLQ